MRILRKQLRKTILAAVSAASLSCSGSPPPASNDPFACAKQTPDPEAHVLAAPADGGWADGGGIGTFVAVDGGVVEVDLCYQVCPPATKPEGVSCTAVPASPLADGGEAWDYDCRYGLNCTGRRPAGLAEVAVSGDGLGAHYTRMAHLEAGSIPAFRRLARELRTHGAPEHLVAHARRAAREEARHARLMSRLAREHGATVPRVDRAPEVPRTLEALAIENAVEGCVRETFGAALALHGARTSAAMAEIAPDELGHAELAWEIDAWTQNLLEPEARARVGAARAEAIHALSRELPDALRPMFDRLREELWCDA